MKKAILLILLCLPILGISQGWEQTFENGVGASVQETADSKFIVTGWKPVNINYQVILLKTNEIGEEDWVQFFGNNDSQQLGYSVRQTNDGGYIIAGQSIIGEMYDAWLIKTDSNGEEEWSQSFNGNYPHNRKSILQTNDEGFIITDTRIISGNTYAWLIKTDTNGEEEWNKTFESVDGNTIGESGQQTDDGGFVLAGRLEVEENIHYAMLLKTDENGEEEWRKMFGENYEMSGAACVQQTTDGGFILTGWKIEPSTLVSKLLLIKTDANGEEEWNQVFGSGSFVVGEFVQQTTDGGFIIAGADDYNVYLIKTNTEGHVTSTFNVPFFNPNRKVEKIIDVLGRESKPKSNVPLFYIYDDGTVEKKIVVSD